MGKAFANEVLMTDRVVTAKKAHQAGFITDVVAGLQEEPDFFDLTKVP